MSLVSSHCFAPQVAVGRERSDDIYLLYLNLVQYPVLTKVCKSTQVDLRSFDFLLQRPALFGFRQTATSDLCKRQASPWGSRISGELPVSCTVFQVQMLRLRNDLTISGRFVGRRPTI